MKKNAFLIRALIFFLVATGIGVLCAVFHAGREANTLPDVPTAQSNVVRIVESKRADGPFVEELSESNADSSHAVVVVCGRDGATAERYEARNDALWSIARQRDLPKWDVDSLMAYVREERGKLRPEREAALKNDVMNLLRNQDPPVEGLAETLIAMIEGKKHPPVVIDYCIQHLGRRFMTGHWVCLKYHER